MSGDPVVITGIGLKSAVGNHATQSAASVRAGLSRIQEWRYGPLVAACVEPDLGDGPWTEKLFALFEQPMAEAIAQAEIWSPGPKSATFISTPYPDRVGVERDELDELVGTWREDLFEPWDTFPLELVALEQAGGVVALARAMDGLLSNRLDQCLVGGVDSLLEPTFLDSLAEAERLKLPESSAGLIPGEAAGFLVLERQSGARKRGVKPLAIIGAVAVDQDSAWAPEAPISAAGLSRAVTGALAAAAGGARVSQVMSDLNGERWRALEWALVDSRCLSKVPHGWRHHHPADVLGDVGAAFVPMAVALVTRSFIRGYGPQGGALICASSVGGQRGALCLFPPEGVS